MHHTPSEIHAELNPCPAFPGYPGVHHVEHPFEHPLALHHPASIHGAPKHEHRGADSEERFVRSDWEQLRIRRFGGIALVEDL
ncbi:hypothetical protein PM082_023277 [Marasmius tenuissimus]|nr:hypothetical protein PM082_023277 [Marasmius tenuissimus]